MGAEGKVAGSRMDIGLQGFRMALEFGIMVSRRRVGKTQRVHRTPLVNGAGCHLLSVKDRA